MKMQQLGNEYCSLCLYSSGCSIATIPIVVAILASDHGGNTIYYILLAILEPVTMVVILCTTAV